MSQAMLELLFKALGETLAMVLVSGAIGLALGIPLGVVLFISKPGQIKEHALLNKALGTVVNIGRSIPFIILIVSIIPLTRLLVGTSIGTMAAVVPLAIGATPFIARLVEGALMEIPSGLVEAARAMGASPLQIIVKVMLPEALPGIINGITITLVTLVGYSAMAGAVGGGGLGDVGIRYGYQRFDGTVMLVVVAILVLLVQIIQSVGERLVRATDHK
ncbi:methionine ABC transporter permease [Plesiomonas shigelloides]|uniref:D-methionine transport system permease protein MetI n=1 Tax=Plesiomonas shigelloides 302-73 TaxID=1315976 RepID=R8AMD1_PLESH|nr:methionine ABC transporter permease [Plesiomonas shigelloides]EON87467.1 ABC-type metal ion transport system,permease component [Plesiomonas shigelloides 302-73]